MYAVIFRAEIKDLDEEYVEAAEQMRALALRSYDCIEFTSVTEGAQEIAISYWETEEQIRKWKEDPKHLAVQERGRSRWYKSYKVQVVEIVREYKDSI